MHISRFKTAAAVAAMTIATLAGCASKKYVRTRVEPLEARVDGLEKKTKQQAGSIEELERGVSRADERAGGADFKAQQAAREAAKASELAGQGIEQAKEANRVGAEAGKAAGDARSLADQGIRKAGDVEQRMYLLDNFKLATSEKVLFAVASTRLSEEAKAQLDAMAATAAGKRRYVVEVQGFTDKTGPAEFNLELSRRRASEVVRYLTVSHKVPLHRIHLLGFGSETPVADNATRDGRRQNRRVEVKLYEADLTATASASTP